MKKFEFGLFALCVLIGGYVDSIFGTAIAICVFMMLSGLIEEFQRKPKKLKNLKEENK